MEGFVAGADEEGGEAYLAGVDAVDGLRGEQQAQGVGEDKVDGEEEEEREVVVARGSHVVVDEEEEEEHHGAYEGGEGGVEELFESGLAEDIAVGALNGVEGKPSERDDTESEPEIGIIYEE